jgi:GNAT superfamily N-acetyltransferase
MPSDSPQDNSIPYTIDGPFFDQAAVCVPILRALPDWFGMEASIAQYAAEIDHLPTFLARVREGVVGFLSIKQHYPSAAEVSVMGIRAEAHRQGLGRALMQAAQAWLKGQGVAYLQVKTLGPSNPDENYARTRAFYLAMGFTALEEFPLLWDADNPCLILVKKL